MKLGIAIHTDSPVREVVMQDGRATGVRVKSAGGDYTVSARQGVVLACGGFPQDVKRIAQAYPHVQRGGEHLSPTPLGNTGDGVNMAEALGATVDIRFKDSAAWMPVSKVPYANGDSVCSRTCWTATNPA